MPITSRPFELQGHRGARGLRPENTLPSFETAIDVGATSVETDIHLTSDGVLVLYHDARLSARICRPLPGADAPDLATSPLVSSLPLSAIAGLIADLNPDPVRFPQQVADVTPLAEAFARQRGMHPYAIPTLDDLFAFVEAYAGQPGADAGKTAEQQARARELLFDLELKRVPFRPETIDDGYDATRTNLLERQVVRSVHSADVAGRTILRSFDHRCVAHVKQLDAGIRTAVLISNTAPVDPVSLVRAAGAEVYAPDVEFLDEAQVRQLHDAAVPVLPWTVNAVDDMRRLLAWGVDGITTDYPDRLAELLRDRRAVAGG